MARYPFFAKVAAASLALLLAACGGGGTSAPAQGVAIEPGFVRTPSIGAPTTAGYLIITSAEDDRLIGARSEAAASVEIHTMSMDNGTMRMRPLEALDLPAGEQVALQPGGDHLMLMSPSDELAEAGHTEIILVFEKAGEIPVTLPVQRN